MKEFLKKWHDNWLEVFIACASLFIFLHFVYIALAFTLYGPDIAGFR